MAAPISQALQGTPYGGVFDEFERQRKAAEAEEARQYGSIGEGLQSYGGSRDAAAAEATRLGDYADAARNRNSYGYNVAPFRNAMGQADASRGYETRGLGMLTRAAELGYGTAASDAARASGADASRGLMSTASLARGGQVGGVAALEQARNEGLLAQQRAAAMANTVRQGEALQAGLSYGAAASRLRQGDLASMGAEQRHATDWESSRQRGMESNAALERGFEDLRGGVFSTQQQQEQAIAGGSQARREAEYQMRRGNEDQARQGMAAGMAAAGSAAASLGPKIGQGIKALGSGGGGYGTYSGGIYRNPYDD